MSASGGVGTFSVLSDGSQWWTALNSEGLTINDNGQVRMELGRGFTKGDYRLLFYSSAGKSIAGIGVSYQTNAGSVLISKQSGEQRAGKNI